MLNELYQLSVALKPEKIALRDWHDDFQPLPKPCYRILISQNGSIAGVEPMSNELVACLRKWEPSNGNSFPGFNIQPLYRIADEEQKKRLKKWRGGKESIDVVELKKWCSEPLSRNWNFNSKKLAKCLGKIPNELQKRCGEVPENFLSVRELFVRVSMWKGDVVNALFHALEYYIWSAFEKGGNVLSLLPILVHEGSIKKKPESDRGTVSVFFDIPDWKDYPVANEKTIEWINGCLLKADSNGVNHHRNKRDDAFGSTSEGCEKKLPDVKLPVISKIILRAMNSESSCQYRYGTIDAASFRIGADSRKRIKRALVWLGDKSHEGHTWGQVDRKELLFVYPAFIPKMPIKLAACLGARKSDDTEARFVKYAEEVVDCLKGLAPSLKEIELHVFSLRKMDKARTKVVFHRNYSAQRLADAAREWQQGCANIPVTRIRSWGEEKGETIFAEPETPFPLQIAECLNRVWKLDGTSKCEVKSIPKSTGIELLLDESAALRQVPHLLTVALQNGKGLFLSLGNSLHRNEVIKLDGFNKHKQLMPAILGLLLWKLDIGKEIYMNHPPYLVGRMLKLADDLHALYCKEVRKNKLPPQLLGNALMVAALDSPTQALSQLALRIAPYLGWARTNSTESAGLSRYFLKEFGLVEAKLREAALPTRLDDAARAQLLLGYISSSSQTEEPTNN